MKRVSGFKARAVCVGFGVQVLGVYMFCSGFCRVFYGVSKGLYGICATDTGVQSFFPGGS